MKFKNEYAIIAHMKIALRTAIVRAATTDIHLRMGFHVSHFKSLQHIERGGGKAVRRCERIPLRVNYYYSYYFSD